MEEDSQNNNYRRAVNNLEKLYQFSSKRLTQEQRELLSFDLLCLKCMPAYGELPVIH